MLATLIIVFREIVEAALVIGIVLAATRGVPGRGLWVSYGVGLGVFGACLVAALAGEISKAFSGNGQELLNVSILSAAVLMLAWHNIWMAHHGREMVREMKDVAKDVVSGRRSLVAIAVVVGAAVMREGSEIVLFLYGIAVSGNEAPLAMVSGGLGGLLLGALTGGLMYFGLLRIPERHLFRVTGWMITLLAAGMASQAVAFLQQAQIVTILDTAVWNSSAFISNDGWVGKVLHTLVGYTDHPTGLQLLVYALTAITIFVLARVFTPKRTPFPA